METNPKPTPSEIDHLNQRIGLLEKRLTRLEKNLASQEKGDPQSDHGEDDYPEFNFFQTSNVRGEAVESRFGEFGMAWLGNIVLLFGILFLTQYLQKTDHALFSLVFGFVSVTGIYLAGYFTKTAYPYMSRLFTYNGHIMLYVVSMRIYVFSGSRITENALIGYSIALLVIVALIYIAYRNKSQVLAVIVWIMAVITAFYSNSTHLMLSLALVITGSSIFFASRNGWWIGLTISIFLVYFTFLIWITGDPFVSGSFKIIAKHQYGYIYLFLCALAYSSLALFPKSERGPANFLTAGIIMNGIGFSFILTLAVLAFFTETYYIYFGFIAAFCMAYSIILQSRGVWKSIAALYAIYSFVSLSISIAGIYHFPLAYFLLSIQSLLVVSMALWFRSRFIVIMNTILYIGLLITYLATRDALISINFSFALVALVTARIMNWKKKRLEIRTELIRNIYLITGFTMILYSLHHALPAQWVTLSWALTGLLFFVLSIVIKNMKYRWLAIITMVITVFYLFIVDLQNISLGYRIVALLFLSIVSLGISIFYTKRQKQNEQE